MVPFLRGVRSKKRGREATPLATGGGFAYVRQFFVLNLPWTLMDLDKTWYDWSLGQGRRNDLIAFFKCHQGAELFSTEGQNLGVFVIFKEYWCLKELLQGARGTKERLNASWALCGVVHEYIFLLGVVSKLLIRSFMWHIWKPLIISFHFKLRGVLDRKRRGREPGRRLTLLKANLGQVLGG